MDDEVLELRCEVCETWHPQDHEDAERLAIEAWTTHMLRLHPEHETSQVLVAALRGVLSDAEGILRDGGVDA